MTECCRVDDTHPEHAITGLLFPGWVDPDVGRLYISNRHRSPSARFCVIYDCRQPFTFQLPWDMIRTERINLTRRLEIATICLIILESVVFFLVIYGCRPTTCVYFWLYISLYLCRRRYGRWEFQNNIYITNQKCQLYIQELYNSFRILTFIFTFMTCWWFTLIIKLQKNIV